MLNSINNLDLQNDYIIQEINQFTYPKNSITKIIKINFPSDIHQQNVFQISLFCTPIAIEHYNVWIVHIPRLLQLNSKSKLNAKNESR